MRHHHFNQEESIETAAPCHATESRESKPEDHRLRWRPIRYSRPEDRVPPVLLREIRREVERALG
jgi:hypothetical protein